MSFDIGFNFRATLGFVSDGANEFFVVTPAHYPTTFGTVYAGFTSESTGNVYNDSDTIDRRLAGDLTPLTGATEYPVFRIDLPGSGDYDVHLAQGYATDTGAFACCEVLDSDGTTVLARAGDGASVAMGFHMDAAGSTWSTAAWPDSEQPVKVTVSGTAIYLRMCRTSGDTYVRSILNHIRVVEAGGGSPAASIFRRTLFNRAGSRGVISW